MLDPSQGQEDGMQADGQYNPGIPCLLMGEIEEFIPDRRCFTTDQAIPAIGACQTRFSFENIRFVQCIIFTVPGTCHTVST